MQDALQLITLHIKFYLSTKLKFSNEIDYQLSVFTTSVFKIPYMGYVANYVQNPPGMYVAIAGAAFLLMLVFIPDLLGSEDEKEKKKAA